MRLLFLLFTLLNPSLFALDVIVSVAPYKNFIEKISGGEVKAHLLVPEGASPHSFEPSPKQVIAASKSQVWFTIGEHFEEKAFTAIRLSNPAIQKIDLRAVLSLIPTPGGGCHTGCCSLYGFDLHIWLSPWMVETQAKTITSTLSNLLPEKRAIFEENLQKFLGELSLLEKEGQTILAPHRGKTLLASHGAFAYLCRDFGLQMLTLEHEGKEATPKSLSLVLGQVKSRGIKTIFAEVQYSQKPAQYVADICHLQLVTLNPYKETYLENMQTLYRLLGDGL